MYTLMVEDTFCAAHRLESYEGDCTRMHGHTWKVEVKIEGPMLDEGNILVDFRLIKGIIKRFDHKNLNEHFGWSNPTAEFLACQLYADLSDAMTPLKYHPEIVYVRIWESDNASATFTV